MLNVAEMACGCSDHRVGTADLHPQLFSCSQFFHEVNCGIEMLIKTIISFVTTRKVCLI